MITKGRGDNHRYELEYPRYSLLHARIEFIKAAQRAIPIEEAAKKIPGVVAVVRDGSFLPGSFSSGATVNAVVVQDDGKVVVGYGPQPGGLHNDGINIAADPGTPVKAADDGVDPLPATNTRPRHSSMTMSANPAAVRISRG